MREFESGATRDDAEGKLSYFKALSPLVLQRYVQYLGKHRRQADGKLRDWDNWKKGIPLDAYMDSLLRHTVDLWLSRDHTELDAEEIEDLVCAVLFNAQGMLFEMLESRDAKGDDDDDYDEDTKVPYAPKPRRVCGDCAKAPCIDGLFDSNEDATDRTCFKEKKPRTCSNCATQSCTGPQEHPNLDATNAACFKEKQ
jgi:hypothetical protein